MTVVELHRPSEGVAIEMPEAFFEWQLRARADLFEALQEHRPPRFMAAHLPVLSTLNPVGETFPVRSGNKGVGLVPAAQHLARYVAEIDECLDWSEGKPGRDTLAGRIRVARQLYDRPAEVDRTTLGTIEIFQGGTFRNLRRDPRASLLFTDIGPRYASWQMNAQTEIVYHKDLRFRFLAGMRLLFEQESFHVQQPGFSVGYVFSLREIDDKTPRRVSR